MCDKSNDCEFYFWISSQVLIIVVALILGGCHFNERRKFKNKLIDFRDIRDTLQYKNNQVDPMLAPLNG